MNPKSEACEKVVRHLVQRLRDSEEVRYHLGIGTESFELLAVAGGLVYGEPEEKVKAYMLGEPVPAA